MDTAAGGRTSYRNAAQTQRYGLELQLSWRPNAYWRHQFNGHYLSAQFEDAELDGNSLPGVARSQLHWQLTYLPWQSSSVFSNTELSLHSQYRSKVYLDDGNSAAAPAAVTFSLCANHSQQWQQLTLDYWLALDNITDKDHVGSVIVNQSNGRAIEPAPGRQFSAGISARYSW